MIRTPENVVYYDYTHSYLLDGKKLLIGVTSLMKKHGLSADYGDVDDQTLAHAADLGKQAHKAIEDYCNGIAVVQTPLIKSFIKLGLNIVGTEVLVSDCETTASSIDLLNQVDENVYDIIDMKRTSSVHKDALAWQLGIYKYLVLLLNPGITINKCYCLPIKKGNKDDILADTCKALVEITPKDESEVTALIKAEKEGRIYQAESQEVAVLDLLCTSQEMKALASVSALASQLKEAEKQIAELKDRIYCWMLDHNIDEASADGVTVKLKRPYQKSALDSKMLKSKYPDIADECTKTSEVKGNITIS